MSTATIEKVEQTTITPAAPLSVEETNRLIELAASTEKVAKVRAASGTRESRGWSMAGNVD